MKQGECEVCSKMVKEKYKHYKTWKLLAIVFMCLTFLFAVLYFANGDFVKDTSVEYNNNVVIDNSGNNNANSNNGNITVDDNTQTIFTIICIIAMLGGIGIVCYFISSKKDKNK